MSYIRLPLALAIGIVACALAGSAAQNVFASERGVEAAAVAPTAIDFGMTTAGSLGSSAPTSPPVVVCGNSSLLTGPSTPPPGAITIPAGDDSNLTASYELQSNTTYWLAPGIHTLGTGPYSQFQPDPDDTFVGAPGAVLDGQGMNQFAFTDNPNTGSPGVTIEYLTIRNFISGEGEGVVNQAGQPNWIVEHNTVGPNEENGTNPGGAGVMLGTNNVVEYNCLAQNGEYGFSSFGSSANITLSYNEIAYNDAEGGYDQSTSPISCGCSGGGKLWISNDVLVTDNYVHDNGNVGIWVDTDNTGVLIAHNYVANNYAEGVIYEISYNGEISNNTFIRNALGGGPEVAGFPDSAVYISESGFDPRVANPLRLGSFPVEHNVFSDNWGGVVIWENPNRYCSDGSDQVCTLVNPAVYTLASCAANLAERAPLNYYDNCRWRAENVSVVANLFSYEPSDIGADCTTANFCGFNGLFSAYGEPPYSGPAVPINITFDQNNHFMDNEYAGPWQFEAWSQGNPDNPTNWTVWRADVTDACSAPSENASGTCDSGFGQDQGSSYNVSGAPVVLSFTATPPSITLGNSTRFAVTVFGEASALTFAYAGLPLGCQPANTTILSCTPTQAGQFTVAVYVNDSSGGSASANASLTVSAGVTGGGGQSPPTAGPTSSSSNPLGDWVYLAIATGAAATLLVAWLVFRARRGKDSDAPTSSMAESRDVPEQSLARR